MSIKSTVKLAIFPEEIPTSHHFLADTGASSGDKSTRFGGDSANRLVFFLFQPNGNGQKENRMQDVKPLLCSIPDAAGALSISRSKTYELISQGVLLTVTIGRRRLVRLDSVKAIVFGEAA